MSVELLKLFKTSSEIAADEKTHWLSKRDALRARRGVHTQNGRHKTRRRRQIGEINLDVPNDEVLPPNNDSQSQETLTLDPALASSADNTQLEQLICEEITQPASEVPGTSSEPTGSELNPELLIALGASTSDAPEFGAKIHETLTNLWSPLLKKGLPKDNPRTPVLQSPKLSAERDETLFGTDLSEKIKASKAIERQGSQIKKTKQKSNSQSTASRSNQQGNWVGPPRYPSNRGGARRSENEVDSISATGGTTTSTILLEHSVQHKIYAAEDSCANPQPPLVQVHADTLSRLTETSKAPERDTTRRLTSRVSAGESEWIGATGGPPAEVVLRLHPSPADTPRVNISSLSDADGSGIVVRAEEALIVAFVLLLWVAAIALFFNRWGKIRMLEPYQPKFQQQHRQSCVLAESSVAVAPHHRASLSRGCMSYDYGSSFPTYQTCGYMAHRPRQNSVFVGSMGMALIPESPPRRSRSAADLPALVPALDVPQATPRSSRAASLHSTMDLRLYVPSPRTSRAASLNSNVEMPVQVHVRSSATNLNRPRSPRRLTITNV